MKEYRMYNFRIFIDDEDLQDEDFQKYDIINALKLGSIYYNVLLTDPKTGTVAVERMKIPLSHELKTFINGNKGKPHHSNFYSKDKELYRMQKLQKAINDYLLGKYTREGNKMRIIEKNINMIEKEINADITENNDSYDKSIIKEKINKQEKLDFIAFLDMANDDEMELRPEGNGLFLSQIIHGSNESIELYVSPAAKGPIKISTLLCKINREGENIIFEYPNKWRQKIFKSSISYYSGIKEMTDEFIKSTEDEANRIREKHKELLKNNMNFDVIQVKISIKNTHPPIWRRLLLPIDMTLNDLHLVIQAAFGWHNSYSYRFDDAYKKYSDVSKDKDKFLFDVNDDSRKTRLNDVVYKEGQKIKYEYYAKRLWELTLTVEKMFEKKPSVKMPACIGGRKNPLQEDESWFAFNTIVTDEDNEFNLDSTDSKVKNYKDLDNSDAMF